MPPSYSQPTDNQNTATTEPQFPSQTPNTFPSYTEPPTTSFAHTQSSAATEPRNLLAALLLTLAYGTTGLHQLYLGRKKQAWIRFGFFLATLLSYALVFVSPAIGVVAGILAFIVIVVLLIWGIVDIFKVYLKRVDGDGNALHAEPRDAKAAKIIFWASIIIYAVMPIVVALLTINSLSSYNRVQKDARESMERRNSINERRLREYNEFYQ